MRHPSNALVSWQMFKCSLSAAVSRTLETWRRRPQLCSKSNNINKKKRQRCESTLIYFIPETRRESGYRTAGRSRHLWSPACVCTRTAEDGDRGCKYQTWQMSFYRCVSGILPWLEEILKRRRHNGKLFIASVLSAAELRDRSLLFSFIRRVVPYTHWRVCEYQSAAETIIFLFKLFARTHVESR